MVTSPSFRCSLWPVSSVCSLCRALSTSPHSSPSIRLHCRRSSAASPLSLSSSRRTLPTLSYQQHTRNDTTRTPPMHLLHARHSLAPPHTCTLPPAGPPRCPPCPSQFGNLDPAPSGRPNSAQSLCGLRLSRLRELGQRARGGADLSAREAQAEKKEWRQTVAKRACAGTTTETGPSKSQAEIMHAESERGPRMRRTTPRTNSAATPSLPSEPLPSMQQRSDRLLRSAPLILARRPPPPLLALVLLDLPGRPGRILPRPPPARVLDPRLTKAETTRPRFSCRSRSSSS